MVLGDLVVFKYMRYLVFSLCVCSGIVWWVEVARTCGGLGREAGMRKAAGWGGRSDGNWQHGRSPF